MKLFAEKGSYRANKILVVAELAGLEIEVPSFVLGKDNRSDEFRKLNPSGRIPALITDKGTVFESNAIARFVARVRNDKALYGRTFQETGVPLIHSVPCLNMEFLELGELLGEGTTAKVFEATNQQTGAKFAIKQFKEVCITMEDAENLCREEFMTHRSLQTCEQIVKLWEARAETDSSGEITVYLILEHMDESLLHVVQRWEQTPWSTVTSSILPSPGTFPLAVPLAVSMHESVVKRIMFQILRGLAFMHSQGIWHRDLKPENVLVRRGSVKIGDMGWARSPALATQSSPSNQSPLTQRPGTLWYCAPECFLTVNDYTGAMDNWAVACLWYELLTGCPLFPAVTFPDLYRRQVEILGEPPLHVRNRWQAGASPLGVSLCKPTEVKPFDRCRPPPRTIAGVLPSVSQECVDLVSALLIWSSDERPSAEQVILHPYFLDLRLQAEVEEQEPTLWRPKLIQRERHHLCCLKVKFKNSSRKMGAAACYRRLRNRARGHLSALRMRPSCQPFTSVCPHPFTSTPPSDLSPWPLFPHWIPPSSSVESESNGAFDTSSAKFQRIFEILRVPDSVTNADILGWYQGLELLPVGDVVCPRASGGLRIVRFQAAWQAVCACVIPALFPLVDCYIPSWAKGVIPHRTKEKDLRDLTQAAIKESLKKRPLDHTIGTKRLYEGVRDTVKKSLCGLWVSSDIWERQQSMLRETIKRIFTDCLEANVEGREQDRHETSSLRKVAQLSRGFGGRDRKGGGGKQTVKQSDVKGLYPAEPRTRPRRRLLTRTARALAALGRVRKGAEAGGENSVQSSDVPVTALTLSQNP
uniref:Protein kinase domain-containing protein n=1 Tax=Chromera velia CCMP2878 TaxID=1169474 RepID=A0A0G4FZ05_9ALVE|eukprot:Cvel_19420.t1-p1 / transcript=Cvel_19420.t1 / gene=Cvel_19420 / organism=Chromera_velia_CCMP2878 / gene_product=Cyclin-dependent kinase F-3, putative / transcript_product=Cyclin-dependent kinase F-3, putative / location=Cvel_scaffold1672:27711-38359(+) / protein_length=812 / sequence_SO=supercontig / SO=protein_coding / is_pseudo=false